MKLSQTSSKLALSRWSTVVAFASSFFAAVVAYVTTVSLVVWVLITGPAVETRYRTETNLLDLLLSPLAGAKINNIGERVCQRAAFDLNKAGWEQKIAEMIQNAQRRYGNHLNVAAWNMHLSVDQTFSDIIKTNTIKMSDGSGFCIVVFRGSGSLRNNSILGCLGSDK